MNSFYLGVAWEWTGKFAQYNQLMEKVGTRSWQKLRKFILSRFVRQRIPQKTQKHTITTLWYFMLGKTSLETLFFTGELINGLHLGTWCWQRVIKLRIAVLCIRSQEHGYWCLIVKRVTQKSLFVTTEQETVTYDNHLELNIYVIKVD